MQIVKELRRAGLVGDIAFISEPLTPYYTYPKPPMFILKNSLDHYRLLKYYRRKAA